MLMTSRERYQQGMLGYVLQSPLWEETCLAHEKPRVLNDASETMKSALNKHSY